MNISRLLLPVLVIAALFSGYFLRAAFTKPTTTAAFEQSLVNSENKTAILTCIVEGVKCKGTANFFTQLFTGASGIMNLETFASEHKVIFEYDPEIITSDDIRNIIEQKITFKDGSQRQVFKCLSMK